MEMTQAFREGTQNGLSIISKNGNTYTPDQLNLKWLGNHAAITNNVGMSSAKGTVTFKKDDLVLYYEYSGTSDIAIPALYTTFNEMWENWRNHEERECKCGKQEDVIIRTTYGKGFGWEGEACRHCMCITKNLTPTFYQDHDEDYQIWR